MRSIVITVAILFVSTTAHAWELANNWDLVDTTMAVGFVATRVIDTMQTLDIKNHADLQEGNPIMGAHPDDNEVLVFMVGGTALWVLVSAILPQDIRRGMLLGGIVGEVIVTANNHRLGLRVGGAF